MTDINELAAAESRRLALQAEAAINIAVGMVLHKVGETAITLSTAEVQEFSAKYHVDQTENDDGSYTLRIVKR